MRNTVTLTSDRLVVQPRGLDRRWGLRRRTCAGAVGRS